MFLPVGNRLFGPYAGPSGPSSPDSHRTRTKPCLRQERDGIARDLHHDVIPRSFAAGISLQAPLGIVGEVRGDVGPLLTAPP